MSALFPIILMNTKWHSPFQEMSSGRIKKFQALKIDKTLHHTFIQMGWNILGFWKHLQTCSEFCKLPLGFFKDRREFIFMKNGGFTLWLECNDNVWEAETGEQMFEGLVISFL